MRVHNIFNRYGLLTLVLALSANSVHGQSGDTGSVVTQLRLQVGRQLPAGVPYKPLYLPILIGLQGRHIWRGRWWLQFDTTLGIREEERPDGEWLRWYTAGEYPPLITERPPNTLSGLLLETSIGLLAPIIKRTDFPIYAGLSIGLRHYREKWHHENWYPSQDFPNPPPSRVRETHLTLGYGLVFPFSRSIDRGNLEILFMTSYPLLSPSDLGVRSSPNGSFLRFTTPLWSLRGSKPSTHADITPSTRMTERPFRISLLLGLAMFEKLPDCLIRPGYQWGFQITQNPDSRASILIELSTSRWNIDTGDPYEGEILYIDLDTPYEFWEAYPLRPEGRIIEAKVGQLLTLLQMTGFRLRAGALVGTRYHREWWSFWYPFRDIPDIPPPESPGPQFLHILDIRTVLVIGRTARASRIHVGYVWHLGKGVLHDGRTTVNPDGYRLTWAIPLGHP